MRKVAVIGYLWALLVWSLRVEVDCNAAPGAELLAGFGSLPAGFDHFYISRVATRQGLIIFIIAE